MQMLNWNNDQYVQKMGIELANQVEDISLLIQPMNFGGKAIWDNCANVLIQKSDQQLEPYLILLLEWLQDLNWPGALKILDRLKKVDPIIIKQPFEICAKAAIKSKDLPWEYALRLLLKDNVLAQKKSPSIVQVFQQCS